MESLPHTQLPLLDSLSEDEDQGRSRFDRILPLVLCLVSVVWWIQYRAYLQRPIIEIVKAPIAIQIKKVIQPTPEPEPVNEDSAAQDSTPPSPATPLQPITAEKNNKEPEISLDEIRKAIQIPKEPQQPTHSTHGTVFDPRMRSKINSARQQRLNTINNQKRPKIETYRAVGGDLYVETDGCAIRQKSFGALEGTWWIVGCKDKKLDLNIPKLDKPSFD